MATLYDLTNQYKQLLDLAEEVDVSAFQDALEHLEDSINEKAENIAFVLQEMKYQIEILKSEEKRLKARRVSLENKQEHLRWYLTSELDQAQIEKVKLPQFTISLRYTPDKVVIENEESLSDEYFITKREPNKNMIKEALKEGKEIEGASLSKERTVSIR